MAEPHSPTDRAVARALSALPCPLYEVGFFDTASERMLLRSWDADGLKGALGFAKAQNVKGQHIYFRPAGPHRYSLLDDLNATTLKRLTDEGFKPSVVIETSPGNFQAWLDHGRVLPNDVSTAVAKSLAERFGADPSSADWRHFGRLPGFTNRKEKYQQPDGKYPFVRLTSADGGVYPNAAAFVASIEAEQEHVRAEDAAKRSAYQNMPRSSESSRLKTIHDFRNDMRYGGDNHRVDLAFCAYSLARNVPIAEIEAALHSRDLSHKGSVQRQNDYITRTIEKAGKNLESDKGISR
jgi:hypothetical protein